MTILRVLVTFNREDGVPADATTNTFHFNTGGVLLPTDAAEVRGRVLAFYNTATTGMIQSIGKYLSREIVGAEVGCKVYDLNDPEPRVPVLDSPFVVTEGSSGDNMVSEVAVCLSYGTAVVAGDVRARHRGRLFIGPLNVQAQEFMAGEPTVSADLRGDLGKAAQALIAQDTALLKWSVYSRADGTAHAPITHGWVDNAFDIQRRRGVKATIRSAWTA